MTSFRTDIIAFYGELFTKILKDSYVLVRNNFNPRLVSHINFYNVDLIK